MAPKEYFVGPQTPPKTVLIIQHALMAAEIAQLMYRGMESSRAAILAPQTLDAAMSELRSTHPSHSMKMRRDDTLKVAWAVYNFLKMSGVEIV